MMGGKGQKCALLLAVAGGLLSLVPCYAQEPQAGRYQLSVASSGGGEYPVTTTLYLMDTVTGDIFRQDPHEKDWRYFSSIPPPAVLDEVKARHERATAEQKERAAKRDAEIKAEREVISTLFRTGTLEEQVRASDVIRVIRYGDDLEITEVLKESNRPASARAAIKEEDYDTSTPRGARAAREAQKRAEDNARLVAERERLKAVEMAAALAQGGEPPVPPSLLRRPASRSTGNTFVSPTWSTLSDIPMEKGEVFVSFLVKGSTPEVVFASERLKLPEPEFKVDSVHAVLVLPSTREPSELVKEIKAILAKEE